MDGGRAHGGIRIGTQGWNYAAWRGPFYPPGTPPARFLSLYARAFDTVEVDSTFYAVPPARTVRGWVERTPPGFAFALKLPREITHERRLRNVEPVLEEFLDRARGLGDRLGPILIQFAPDFPPAELPALARFLRLLPADLRFAVELRQREWITRELHELLAGHRVALALSDGRWIPRRWLLSLAARPTADFHYVRWMGPDRRITDFSHLQVDRTPVLEDWAEALRPLPARGLQVFGYFNNHFAGHSPGSARLLQERLGQAPVDPAAIGDQGTLF